MSDLYLQGFIEKCAEHGVDPEKVAQYAQQVRNPNAGRMSRAQSSAQRSTALQNYNSRILGSRAPQVLSPQGPSPQAYAAARSRYAPGTSPAERMMASMNQQNALRRRPQRTPQQSPQWSSQRAWGAMPSASNAVQAPQQSPQWVSQSARGAMPSASNAVQAPASAPIQAAQNRSFQPGAVQPSAPSALPRSDHAARLERARVAMSRLNALPSMQAMSNNREGQQLGQGPVQPRLERARVAMSRLNALPSMQAMSNNRTGQQLAQGPAQP